MRPATDADRERVLLVPGLWMSARWLHLLARRLGQYGFDARPVQEVDWRRAPEDNARVLADMLQGQAPRRVHLVGHSLGGIVILHLLAGYRSLPVARVVLLATPVRGSLAARRLVRWRILRPLFGRSLERGLLGGAPRQHRGVEIGVIAGSRPLGLGALLHPRGVTRDGAVALGETRLDGHERRLLLPASHLSLLVSRRAARATADFLATGRFDTAPQPARPGTRPDRP